MLLELNFTEDLPSIVCDPELMQIVIVNLLSNGVKYGYEHGRLRVQGEINQGVLRVSVWNTGPGFPSSERQRLFRKFSRIPTPELMKQKGTGVGLYTTWQIINRHGGKIRAASEQNQWAEFVIELPVADEKATEGTEEDVGNE